MTEVLTPTEMSREIRDEIQRLSEVDPSIAARVEIFEAGEVFLREGESNANLFLVLDGELQLKKRASDGSSVVVSTHSAGDLLGVSSFATQYPSLCTAEALTAIHVFRLDAEMVGSLSVEYPALDQIVKQLMVANLANRYRAAVSLQIDLLEANHELTETRNQLIHKERLALLGNLVAGVAHELNNPASAILRECDHLEGVITALLGQADAIPDDWRRYWDAGAKRNPATGSARSRLTGLEGRYPQISRAHLRAVAALPGELEGTLVSMLAGAAGSKPPAIEVADAAFLLRAVSVSAMQITHLVTALKTHARPGGASPESVSLAESIGNSLVMLGHLARHHAVECELDPDLAVLARPGDINQVWTNLIKNAFEAMGRDGVLKINACRDDGMATVTITDNGPGIPSDLSERIFDVNFTTKRGQENFGLGLGLSISRSLIENLGGSISHRCPDSGGCEFVVRIPAWPQGGNVVGNAK